MVSLIVPEATNTKNFLIMDYAEKINSVSQKMKGLITNLIDEIEDTRKEMHRVAKLMIKYKEKIKQKNFQSHSA